MSLLNAFKVLVNSFTTILVLVILALPENCATESYEKDEVVILVIPKMHVLLFLPRLFLLEIMVRRQFWGESKTNGFRDTEEGH